MWAEDVICTKRGIFQQLKNVGQTHLGISTPLSQSISRSPNGWSPRMYWSGNPFDRSRHIDLRVLLQPDDVVDLPSLPLVMAMPIAFSLSQRSSFRADGKVRHSRRSNGRSGFSLYALSTNRVETRGMSESLRIGVSETCHLCTRNPMLSVVVYLQVLAA